jgi:hypothetical protein
MLSRKSQTTTGLLSLILSFLASSHHWLHTGILLLLGGSTNMMTTMSAVLWLRRLMIVMTILTVLISVYRLYRHRCKDTWIIALTSFSIVISVGFVTYTLYHFGW